MLLRIHAIRNMPRWSRQPDGGWREKNIPMHAWAEFLVDRHQVVDVAESTPLAGTYRNASKLGLFWSGYALDDPDAGGSLPVDATELMDIGEKQVALFLTEGKHLVGRTVIDIGNPARHELVRAQGMGWAGVFAYPTAAREFPTVISLHGSEGGKIHEAEQRAVELAGAGFAALSVVYFAGPPYNPPTVPVAHEDIRVEILEQIRDWLRARPEANVRRLGIYGHSKGAEFALLAASKYPWIKAVVACAGSDVVWQGYSIRGLPSPEKSSWTIEGKQVPFVPLLTHQPDGQRWSGTAERYAGSRRAATSAVVDAARIRVEHSRARFLLLGGGRDPIWDSGGMMSAAFGWTQKRGNTTESTLHVEPRAGHQICGDGIWPVRLYGRQTKTDDAIDVTKEGETAEQNWDRSMRFFKQAL